MRTTLQRTQARGAGTRSLPAFVTVMLCLAFAAPASIGDDTPADAASDRATSSVSGTVRSSDGTGAAGAEVLLVPLGGAEAAYRATTDAGGDFEMPRVRHGYYDLTVNFGSDIFLSNRVLLVSPEKKIKVEFDLGEITQSDRQGGLDESQVAPGTDRKVTGVARLRERLGPTGWAWFKTGRGVAVLLGGGTAVIAGIIALADDELTQGVVSPVTP